MYLEYSAIIVLGAMVLVHIRFDRIYSRRIMQLETETKLLERDVDGYDEPDDVLVGGAGMLAQAEVDHTNNRYALVIIGMCASGLSILTALHHADLSEPVGWMSLLLLMLPALMLLHHIRNTRIVI